jgi:deoxyribonuclease-4
VKVALSCHLPFWINLGNEKRDKNVEYLVQGLRIAHQIESVAVFHLGFYGGQPFEQLLPAIISILHEVADKAGMGAGRLGIETTGKQKALGTVDEVLAIVAAVEDERFMPVIDWAHLYARANGSCPTSRQHVRDILRKCDDACPGISYFHGGGIEFSNGNELRHVSHDP